MAAATDSVQNNVAAERPGSDIEIGMIDLKENPGKEELKTSRSVLPILFEGSAKTWWNPKFLSDSLENQLQRCLLPQTFCRFRLALLYIAVSCLLWCIYFAIVRSTNWIPFFTGTVVLLVVAFGILGFTYAKVSERIIFHLSIFVILILICADLLSFVYNDPAISATGTFIGSIEILILLYTFITLPLYICFVIGGLYSVAFEVLSALTTDMQNPTYIFSRVLIHIVIHVIGIHIYLMAQVRKRSTFLKVCQSVRLRQDLEVEKQLKRCMINSLMPPKVAEEIIKLRDHERDREGSDDDTNERGKHRRNSDGLERGRMTFRLFHMSKMDNVSILFADIVGFTKMSSKKTAEHLVFLLSDLFGRFDKICVECNCEKISTLGDCYYCVSGCPEPRDDHAKCCVEMGLKMCVAIKQFDRDHNEEVNMRVGVHTGTVLCGLVGTRRFKFDVWSHDVTLANTMESEGKAGMVHISDYTYNFVKDDYFVDEGDPVPDIRTHQLLTEFFDAKTQQFIVHHVSEKERSIATWFITGRKSEVGQTGGIQNGATQHNDIDTKSGADDMLLLPNESSPSLDKGEDGALPPETLSTVNEDTKLETNLSAVGLIGKRETSTHEEIDDSNLNGTAVAHLLGPKKQDQEVDKELNETISKQTENYLYHPAINHWTVRFRSNRLEKKYRRHYVKSIGDSLCSCASPHVSSLFDTIVSLIFFLLISVCCFISFGPGIPLVIVFVVSLIMLLFLLALMLLNIYRIQADIAWIERVRHCFSSWYPRHIFGGFLASLPTLAVYSTFLCGIFTSGESITDRYYCLLVISSLVHFCNFTLLSSWMKSCLAIASGAVLLILLGIGFCYDMIIAASDQSNSTRFSGMNETATEESLFLSHSPQFQPLFYEIIIDTVLLLLLIFFLNREVEISYRVSYHGDVEAVKDREKMQTEEQQADWLLHNIVPEHVAEHLKQNNKYSKTHKDIGVIFAKIVNFEDFYDESFEGGKEYLRVLNELMGDFEELFDKPKYHDIEKIKTIGSCLMAASGLNPRVANENSNAHLCALMDFSYELLHKLEQFNKEIFNFDFEMSIGYNFGEVTAGVVGTTKLLYDIWGDTVNIASRMYSTGVHGRIQVTEDTAVRLSDYFDFEPRGQVFVKGKGDMNVFLLSEKKKLK